MRRGELAGLEWQQVNLPDDGYDGATICISQALKKNQDGTTELGDTKTENVRTIPIPAHLVDVLRQHRKNQEAATGKLRDGLGFPVPP